MKPLRTPLFDFPDSVLHAEELTVKKHPQFHAAKGGGIEAAGHLVKELTSPESVETLRAILAGRPAELVPIHALETEGVTRFRSLWQNYLRDV